MTKSFFDGLSKMAFLLAFSLITGGCSLFSSSDDADANKTSNSQANTAQTTQSRADNSFVPTSSNTPRTSFGYFVVPGISLNRWNNSKDVAAWRETNQPLVSVQNTDDIIRDVAVSHNGMYMASVGAKINVWDLDTLTLIRSWELDSIGRQVLLTPDGKSIISVHEDSAIRIWQQETGFNTAVLRHSKSISAITISADGSRIASADIGGDIFIWDTFTGKKLYSIDDILRVNTLKFSKDGSKLASSGISKNDANYTVQIWETRFYSLEISLPGHRAVVNSVDFSPDSRFIVTASRDNTIKVWDLQNGALFKTLRGHTDDVVKSVFSDDGHWLISASLDDKIRIWSFPSGRTVQSLNIPYLKSKSLSYASNRNWIVVVGGGNQDIQIWSSSGFTYKPWDDIHKRVARLYQDRQKVVSIPLIPKPQLPSLDNLKKDPFESQLFFVDRVARIYGPRINRQIVEYRTRVDARNKKIALLRQDQRDSRRLVTSQIRNIAVRTAKKVLGELILFPLSIDGRPAYDPDKQLMKIRVNFTRAFYREDFLLSMPEGIPAKAFYQDLIDGKIIGNGIFKFISDSRVRLSQVNIRWRGRNFVAQPIRLSSGNPIIPSDLKNVTIPSSRLQFQRYGIPYTNFSDFIRTVLREQLKSEIEAQKNSPVVNSVIRKSFSSN